MRPIARSSRANRDGFAWWLTGHAPMAIRSFVDSRGVSWRVKASIPVVSQLLQVRWRGECLTFNSTGERRRLMHIPADWLTAPPSMLEEYCNAAERIPTRRPWLDLEIR